LQYDSPRAAPVSVQNNEFLINKRIQLVKIPNFQIKRSKQNANLKSKILNNNALEAGFVAGFFWFLNFGSWIFIKKVILQQMTFSFSWLNPDSYNLKLTNRIDMILFFLLVN
jgi:hypothetical protein